MNDHITEYPQSISDLRPGQWMNTIIEGIFQRKNMDSIQHPEPKKYSLKHFFTDKVYCKQCHGWCDRNCDNCEGACHTSPFEPKE